MPRNTVTSVQSAADWCEEQHAVCAWWVLANFEPRDSVIDDVPVGKIRGDWVLASALTLEMLPAPAGELEMLADSSGRRFTHEGDLDADGVPDRATVGVYRTKLGVEGRFLLVTSRVEGRAPRVRVVEDFAGGAGFSVLDFSGGGLFFSSCLECGDVYELQWTGRRFSLVYLGPE